MKKILKLIVILIVISTVGCAAQLRRDAVPKEGRYTVIVRDTQKVTLQHVGTTVFTNVRHRIPVSHDISDQFRVAITGILSSRPGYVYVPISEGFDFTLPNFYVNSYDGSFGIRSSEAFEAQEAAFQEQLVRLAEEHDLDFVITVTEWGAKDVAGGSNQPLVGNGVQFRSFFGSKRVHAHSAYELRVHDTVSGLSSRRFGTGLLRLPSERWVELDKDAMPEPDEAANFIVDIEGAIPPDDLKETLCVLGLLDIPPGTQGNNAWMQCMNAYPGGHN